MILCGGIWAGLWGHRGNQRAYALEEAQLSEGDRVVQNTVKYSDWWESVVCTVLTRCLAPVAAFGPPELQEAAAPLNLSFPGHLLSNRTQLDGTSPEHNLSDPLAGPLI